MKRLFSKKWIKYPFFSFLVIFALIGFFMSGTYVAMKLKLTNDRGSVDQNDRYFQEIRDKYNQSFKINNSNFKGADYDNLQRILILNKFAPVNASYIMDAYLKGRNEAETRKMILAAEMYLRKNKSYHLAVKNYEKNKWKKTNHRIKGSIYDWMNISEWQDFKIAVAKDKKLIDSVSNLTGVESRLIVACLVGEQIRLFNSKREAYKKWIGPLKILTVESQFSLGVTGIKEQTAIDIEKNLHDPNAVYYLGDEYIHLLDFKTDNPLNERVNRLVDYKNHYYSYMYAAIFLKQVKVQWEKAGFPIDDRPEILATLFNVGYPQSKPKRNPKVGGSTIKIYDVPHSFGSVAYEFYYSGELYDIFPYQKARFDWGKL
jgi:hypothetical protein